MLPLLWYAVNPTFRLNCSGTLGSKLNCQNCPFQALSLAFLRQYPPLVCLCYSFYYLQAKLTFLIRSLFVVALHLSMSSICIRSRWSSVLIPRIKNTGYLILPSGSLVSIVCECDLATSGTTFHCHRTVIYQQIL